MFESSLCPRFRHKPLIGKKNFFSRSEPYVSRSEAFPFCLIVGRRECGEKGRVLFELLGLG